MNNCHRRKACAFFPFMILDRDDFFSFPYYYTIRLLICQEPMPCHGSGRSYAFHLVCREFADWLQGFEWCHISSFVPKTYAPSEGIRRDNAAIPAILRGTPVLIISLISMCPVVNPTTFEGVPVGSK